VSGSSGKALEEVLVEERTFQVVTVKKGGNMKRAVIALIFLVACGGNGGWSESERRDFIAGCTSEVPQEFTDEQRAKLVELCQCSAEKAEESGIDPAEFTESDATEFAQECSQE
jgi:hypothetical protein